MSVDGSTCPQCGEPLLAYAAEAGRYLGCPGCLWMSALEYPLSSTPESADDLLGSLPADPIPDWLLGDIDDPPLASEHRSPPATPGASAGDRRRVTHSHRRGVFRQ